MTAAEKIRKIVRASQARATRAKDSRYQLLSSIRRLAEGRNKQTQPLDVLLQGFASATDFPWIIGSAYWTLRRKKGSLPAGTVFTPPKLAWEVIRRLRPGLRVVDLGAGTGMLTLNAA